MKKHKEDRQDWIDVFKALCIILMVVGHATGQFNQYIYQFHMGAFFIVSGFTTNMAKRSVFRTIVDKVYSLLLPLYAVFFASVLLVCFCNRIGIYALLFETEYIGGWNMVTEYMLHGNNYINFLGATWFLGVLFNVHIIQRVLYAVSGKDEGVYAVLSFVVFLLGYYCVDNEMMRWNLLDLSFVAQGYFAIGYLLRKTKQLWQNIHCKQSLVCVVLGGLILCYLSDKGAIVDYPSRIFGNPLTNLIASSAGSVCIYGCAHLVNQLPGVIKKAMIDIGKNTLGILFFHFLYFKLGTVILMAFNTTSVSDLSSFLPPADIKDQQWFLYTSVSILASVVTWKLLLKMKPICILLGCHKDYYILIDHIEQRKILKKSNNFFCKLGSCRVYDYMQLFIKTMSTYALYIYTIIVLCISIFYRYVSTGVILNDELMARFSRMSGLIEGYNQIFFDNVWVKERYSNIFSSLSLVTSFLTSNDILNRCIQAFIIIMAFSLFCFFVYRLFRDKGLAVFIWVCLLSFLPFTFEHSVPNAFVGLTGMIFMLVVLSQYCNFRYLETNQKRFYVVSMLIYLYTLFSYEYCITFVLLYPVMFLYKKNFHAKEFAKYLVTPFLISILYVIFVITSSSMGTYEGASFQFVSLSSSFEILKTLFLAAIPGYFLFNEKYNYLFQLYREKYEYSIDLRVIMIVLCVAVLLIGLYHYNQKRHNQKQVKYHYLVPLVGLTYGVIPAIPLSVSAMYQGNVTSEFFTNLPITFYLYTAIVFSLCWVLWYYVLPRKKIMYAVITAIVLFVVGNIQIQNSVFLEEQQDNFTRITTIEDTFSTEYMKSLNGQTIVAPDFYETQNLLAVNEGYWTDYAHLKGYDIQVSSQENENSQMKGYIMTNSTIVYAMNASVEVLSKVVLPATYAVYTFDQDLVFIGDTQYTMDGEFYCYHLIDVGTTMSQTDFKKGFYEDHWVSTELCFEISTGEQGMIVLEGYYPGIITEDLTMSFEINGKEMNYQIQENDFVIEIMGEPMSPQEVSINSFFVYETDNGDIRELSFLLIDVNGY